MTGRLFQGKTRKDGENMYKIAICDGDRTYREIVRRVIEKEKVLPPDEIQFYEYSSGIELLEDTSTLHNLIFVNIRMPGLNGDKTAQRLRQYNRDAVLVFCSNYFELTPDGINIGQPFRYIMKDMYHKCLKQEMPAILLRVKQCSRRYAVTVTSVGRLKRIPVENVLYICLAKRGCHLYVEELGKVKEARCKESLKDLYGQLSDKGFAYAHNSYIVNLAKVEGLEKNIVFLKDGIQLNISRSKKNQFEDALLDFLQKGSGLL